jgi:hypothetical protein
MPGDPELIGLETPFYGDKAELAQLDPVTLRPVPDRSSKIPFPTQFVVSPDGNKLALGGENGGVDVANLAGLGKADAVRTAFRSRPPGYPADFPVSWPTPRRLIVVEQVETAHVAAPATLIWVNPQTRRITRRLALHRSIVDTATTSRGTTVLLLGSHDLNTIGPTQLVEVTRDGHLHIRSLPEVRAGFVDPGTVGSAEVSPGLAVGHGHVYVASQSLLLAGSLRGLHLDAHHVPNLLGAHFVASTSAHMGSAGDLARHDRTVIVLSRHHLLVTGEDTVAIDHGRRLRSVQAKTAIVDARSWRVVRILPRLSDPVAVRPDIIGAFTNRHGTQIGVAGYHRDGSRAFSRRLTKPQDFWWTDGHLTRYATTGRPRAVLLSPTTGQVTRLVHPLAKDYPFPMFTWTPGHRRTAAPSTGTAGYGF